MALSLALDGDRNDRVRENHRLERGRIIWIAERVPGLHGLHPEERDNVAGLGVVHLVAVVGVHLDDASDPFGLAGRRVEDGLALFDRPGVDAGEGEGAVLVVHDLEGQRAERLAVGDDGELAGLVALLVDFGLGRHLGWGGQIVDDPVQKRLHTLVLERGAAVGREETQVDGAFADALLDRGDVGLLSVQVGLHDLVVLLDGGLDELFAVFLDFVHHVCGNVADFVVQGVAGVIPDPGLAGEQIDNARKIVFGADRQDHDEGSCAEDILDLLDDAVEIGPDPVELVHVDDPGDLGIVGVAPVRLGLGFDPAGTAKNADSPVENLQRTIDLDREINVSGSVDDVETVVVPETGRGRRLDRDAAFLLLVHEVGCRGAVVDFAHFVDLAREHENALGRGRLAGVHVGEDADVAVFGYVAHGCEKVFEMGLAGLCSGLSFEKARR